MEEYGQMIRVLGISASPRQGNSLMLLNEAFSSLESISFSIETEIVSLRGKLIGPCVGCYQCRDKRQCILKDDFHELFLKWLAADVVIYSTPVYHMSIPGQLKCFLDRMGQSVIGYCNVRSARHLKVVGTIVQGAHMSGGEEFAALHLMQHSVLMNCIPVSGDGWESYTCAAGSTKNQNTRDAMDKLKQSGDLELAITLRAAQTTVKRAVETAAILRRGGQALRDQLKDDPRYELFLSRSEVCQTNS